MKSDKDKAKLAEKLTACYNAYCEAKTTMTLATVQAEVKKFWRNVRETRELMYKGTAPSGGNQNGSGQGQGKGNGGKRDRKNKK